MSSSDKNSGFSDLEMGPLVGGKTTHERKKKSVSSDGHDALAATASPGRPGDLKTIELSSDGNGHHKDMPSAPLSSAGTDKYARSKSPLVSGKVAFACGLYSSCSVSMVLVNKSLASRYVVVRLCFPDLVCFI